jgi:hypothetical protein
MAGLSAQTQKLIQRCKVWHESLNKKNEGATIHADEVASQVAAFYEKIRGVIDWREEHLLRRGAIERILKRKLFLRAGQNIDAQPFILELIRAGHFPNDKIEENKITVIQKILDKYVYIIENSKSSIKKTKGRLQDWLSSVAACEVEEILDPPREERLMIEYMTEIMEERIKLSNGLSEEEKNTQVYIAVHKALFKLDPAIITYHLLKREFPQWPFLMKNDPVNGKNLSEITKNIYSIRDDINKKLNYHLAEKFYRVCEKYDTPFLILGDILKQDPTIAREKFSNPESLETEIKKFYQIRSKQQKSKVSRAAILSTISIFLTKMVIALLIEFPIDDKILHQFSWQSLGLNIVIPPLLMFLLVLSIKQPRKSNLDKVVMETMKIVYEGEKKDTYPIQLPHKKNLIMNGIMFLLYLATFYGVSKFIWWSLEMLHFSWTSKIIFIIFVSLPEQKSKKEQKNYPLKMKRGDLSDS